MGFPRQRACWRGNDMGVFTAPCLLNTPGKKQFPSSGVIHASVISTCVPSAHSASINFQLGWLCRYRLIALTMMCACFRPRFSPVCLKNVGRNMADMGFKANPLGKQRVISLYWGECTIIFIIHSTKIRTMSPSAESTSTRLPTAPWRIISII